MDQKFPNNASLVVLPRPRIEYIKCPRQNGFTCTNWLPMHIEPVGRHTKTSRSSRTSAIYDSELFVFDHTRVSNNQMFAPSHSISFAVHSPPPSQLPTCISNFVRKICNYMYFICLSAPTFWGKRNRIEYRLTFHCFHIVVM